MINYKGQSTWINIIIHRSWCIGKLRSEIGYILNINARRIRCNNEVREQLRNNDDIEEYWNIEEATVEILKEDGGNDE
jgi:hypothetical protein